MGIRILTIDRIMPANADALACKGLREEYQAPRKRDNPRRAAQRVALQLQRVEPDAVPWKGWR